MDAPNIRRVCPGVHNTRWRKRLRAGEAADIRICVVRSAWGVLGERYAASALKGNVVDLSLDKL